MQFRVKPRCMHIQTWKVCLVCTVHWLYRICFEKTLNYKSTAFIETQIRNTIVLYTFFSNKHRNISNIIINIKDWTLWSVPQILGNTVGYDNRSAVPTNPTSSRPRSWSLGNATLVVAQRSGWRRVLGAWKPKRSAKGAHPYRSGFSGLGVSVLASGTQVRGFKPGRSRRNYKGGKILNTPSFGREVEPWVPCRRFAACKRTLNVPSKLAFRQNYRSFPRP
jgi:hypothetical protein